MLQFASVSSQQASIQQSQNHQNGNASRSLTKIRENSSVSAHILKAAIAINPLKNGLPTLGNSPSGPATMISTPELSNTKSKDTLSPVLANVFLSRTHRTGAQTGIRNGEQNGVQNGMQNVVQNVVQNDIQNRLTKQNGQSNLISNNLISNNMISSSNLSSSNISSSNISNSNIIQNFLPTLVSPLPPLQLTQLNNSSFPQIHVQSIQQKFPTILATQEMLQNGNLVQNGSLLNNASLLQHSNLLHNNLLQNGSFQLQGIQNGIKSGIQNGISNGSLLQTGNLVQEGNLIHNGALVQELLEKFRSNNSGIIQNSMIQNGMTIKNETIMPTSSTFVTPGSLIPSTLLSKTLSQDLVCVYCETV